MDNIFSLLSELMQQYGVFQGKFHFSSSRATIWHVDDLYSYQLLNIDDLNDPDICLAYPSKVYSAKAVVSSDKIPLVFELFKALRFQDSTVYLRAASLNVMSGMVSLNFSCDGSHYLPCDEFLEKGLGFW